MFILFSVHLFINKFSLYHVMFPTTLFTRPTWCERRFSYRQPDYVIVCTGSYGFRKKKTPQTHDTDMSLFYLMHQYYDIGITLTDGECDIVKC